MIKKYRLLKGDRMINRAVLIVRPTDPFIKWAAGLDDSEVVPSPQDEQTVYLIPQYEEVIDAD